MEENNLTAFDYKISLGDLYVIGMRSGKSNMLQRALKASSVRNAYRQELKNVLTKTK